MLEPELPQYRFERSCHHWEFALEPFVFNLISSDTSRAVGHLTHASYSLFRQHKAGQNGQRIAALSLMGLEVERKFLVNNDIWRARGEPEGIIRQGYLCIAPDRSVRIRLMGDAASLAVKGKAGGRSRQEFEYTIPRHDAEQMLEGVCLRPLIEKTRFAIRDGGLKWEIDEFMGLNHGLVITEVELSDEGQQIRAPSWLGADVTHNPRCFNQNLVDHPYAEWRREGVG